MTKVFIVLVSLLQVVSQPLYAQKLLGNIGLGIGYDVFIRDKQVLPYGNKWPARPGMESLFGITYLPENGFEVFINANLGMVYIEIPAPGYKSRTYFKQFHANISVGSGPQLKTENCGTFIPYIHLGGVFYSDWGEQFNNSDPHIIVQKKQGLPVSDTWVLICGAGLDWQIGKRHLSGLNLQVSFTPVNIYNNAPQYQVSTPLAIYDIKFQGRLLQFMLTYSTHFSIKKWNTG